MSYFLWSYLHVSYTTEALSQFQSIDNAQGSGFVRGELTTEKLVFILTLAFQNFFIYRRSKKFLLSPSTTSCNLVYVAVHLPAHGRPAPVLKGCYVGRLQGSVTVCRVRVSKVH